MSFITLLQVRSLIVTLVLCSGLCTVSTTQAQDGTARRVIEKVAPVYPKIAKDSHIGGAVKLKVVVGPNGTVKSVIAVGGGPVLIQAATNAVRQWKFQPAPEETTENVQLAFNP